MTHHAFELPCLPQVDPSVTEMEFIRRRLEGGTLYALLSEESSNYLHVGPFTDADMELLGTSFAKVRCRYRKKKCCRACRRNQEVKGP